MRIFVTGCKGQLGRALDGALADHTLAGCDLPELDITDREAIAGAIADFEPEIVIHAAAWTDVNGCAMDPEKAYVANALGTQNVALACAACDAAIVYISTNEVFDGTATEPYREWDPPHPINPYGRSKAAGEWYVRHLLTRFYIARTAWLYAPGGRNFPHRIIQLADEASTGSAQGKGLRVVTDEVGNPTYAPDRRLRSPRSSAPLPTVSTTWSTPGIALATTLRARSCASADGSAFRSSRSHWGSGSDPPRLRRSRPWRTPPPLQ